MTVACPSLRVPILNMMISYSEEVRNTLSLFSAAFFLRLFAFSFRVPDWNFPHASFVVESGEPAASCSPCSLACFALPVGAIFLSVRHVSSQRHTYVF